VAERHAVFLDRDGTIIEDPGYLSRPEQVKLLPGAAEGLRVLHEAGFLLVVVSNQSGIGRGILTADEAARVHERLVRDLAHAGVRLDDSRYCPHAPEDGCSCRKPAPGLILDAAAALGVDPTHGFMVGNSASDVAAGRNAGCRTIAIGADVETGADWWVSSWPEVVDIALAAVEAA
jgi:histidinol-phosphate phosphatase family protein